VIGGVLRLIRCCVCVWCVVCVEVALVSTSVVGASVCVVRIEARILNTWLNTGGKGRADGRIGHGHGPRRAERSLSAHASKHTISRICPISVSNETEIGHLDGRGAPELTHAKSTAHT